MASGEAYCFKKMLIDFVGVCEKYLNERGTVQVMMLLFEDVCMAGY